MQRYLDYLDASCLNTGDHIISEMQSGRRGSYRSSLFREYRLITFPVRVKGAIAAFDIRRQRCPADSFKNIIQTSPLHRTGSTIFRSAIVQLPLQTGRGQSNTFARRQTTGRPCKRSQTSSSSLGQEISRHLLRFPTFPAASPERPLCC